MSAPLPLPVAEGPLGGVTVPGSKSVTNRVLLAAALAPGASTVHGGLDADDTRAMRGALRALGIPVHDEEPWRVEGGRPPRAGSVVPVGASGTTLRFLLPWLATQAPAPVTFVGAPRLFARPLAGLLEALAPARWAAEGDHATLHPAPRSALDVTVDASASSQFVTGLALAAAALPGGGALRFGDVPSRSYLDLTRRWLRPFGVDVAEDGPRWTVPGGELRPADVRVPGDWSGAAAFLAAGAATGRPVAVGPLDPGDDQGDRALLDLLAAAGCTVRWLGPATVEVAGPLRRGLTADLALCPDLGPVLAALAALAPGPSVLTGLHTLPHKECDRLDASAELVRWLGGTATVEGDHTLRVTPGPPPPRERVPFDPRADHRMAFAAAVGGLVRGGTVTDPGCVAKTVPTFWADWARMVG